MARGARIGMAMSALSTSTFGSCARSWATDSRSRPSAASATDSPDHCPCDCPYHAASPAKVTRSGVLPVVVVTRHADPLLRPAFGWFLAAAAATLALGGIVAWQLSRRLALPLRHAEEATRRIAAGQLGARVPEEGG